MKLSRRSRTALTGFILKGLVVQRMLILVCLLWHHGRAEQPQGLEIEMVRVGREVFYSSKRGAEKSPMNA